MTDFELAKAFFERLKARGLNVELRDYDGHLKGSESFDPDRGLSFELLDAWGKVAFTFDFLGGDFYRCSGRDSDGFYCDEFDLKKY